MRGPRRVVPPLVSVAHGPAAQPRPEKRPGLPKAETALLRSHAASTVLLAVMDCLAGGSTPAMFLLTLLVCGNGFHLLADSHPQNLPLVCFQHFKPVAFYFDFVSGRRHFAGDMIQKAGQRGHRLIRFLAKMHTQQLLYRINRHASAHDQSAVRFPNYVWCERLSVVTAAPDDLFH